MDKIAAWLSTLKPFRTTRSKRQFNAYYAVDDPNFNLEELYARAAASQACEEKELASADITHPGLADQVGQYMDATLEAQSGGSSPLTSLSSTPQPSPPPSPPPSSPPPRATTRSPSPRRPAKRRRPAAKVKTPRTKKAKKAPLPPFLRPQPPPLPPDFSQYQPAVGGISQAKKRRSRTNRAKKAARRDVWTGPNTTRRIYAQHLRNADNEPADVEWEDMPTTSTGFTAKRGDGESRVYTREELIKDFGFRYCDWSGRTPTGVVAPDGRVFAAFIGASDDPEYARATETLADELGVIRQYITFPPDARDHRRGQFGAQAIGVSHGGGQTEPANLKHTPALDAVLAYLIALPAMIRIAHFASDAFANWAPRLYTFYALMMMKLFASNSTLRRNFPRSVWACLTINFGPRTLTFKHRDFGNLLFGWCAITALGSFDPDRGGDIVLWECGLIVRFPPGSTVLIPSAIISHSNTAIAEGETRYSVTQYTSGALFRWVEHGLQLDEDFYAGLSAKERDAALQANSERWEKGVKMWSTWEELQERAAKFS